MLHVVMVTLLEFNTCKYKRFYSFWDQDFTLMNIFEGRLSKEVSEFDFLFFPEGHFYFKELFSKGEMPKVSF